MPHSFDPSSEVVNAQFRLGKIDRRYLRVAMNLFGYRSAGPFLRDVLMVLVRHPALLKIVMQHLAEDRRDGEL